MFVHPLYVTLTPQVSQREPTFTPLASELCKCLLFFFFCCCYGGGQAGPAATTGQQCSRLVFCCFFLPHGSCVVLKKPEVFGVSSCWFLVDPVYVSFVPSADGFHLRRWTLCKGDAVAAAASACPFAVSELQHGRGPRPRCTCTTHSHTQPGCGKSPLSTD